MRFLSILFVMLLTASAITACDAHDYWLLTETLEVSSDNGILVSRNIEPLSQELFVRYQLDYQVENTSSKTTEVVVSATSYVNDNERATAQKIWHLEPSETGAGILTTNQLELGNSLVVSLQCCGQSQCSRSAVQCPTNLDSLPDTDDIALFCYDSCRDTSSCVRQCPSEVGCDNKCAGTQDREKCRKEFCAFGGTAASCAYECADKDENCFADCKPTPECENTCISRRATCFRNCISTWTQCTDAVYWADSGQIPCALCGGEGICNTNFTEPSDEINRIRKLDGTEYICTPDCSQYPAACVTGCDDNYSEDEERLQCLARCLEQHLFWCNDYQIPTDYVVSQGKQPCCFESYCSNAMSGVVKTYDVECFNDTSCSSGKSCSSEGICVSKGASNCSSTPLKPSSPNFWLIMPLAAFLIRRKRGRHV